ncbi:hypothetical protein [Ornithinibacillus halotolerans]|uniref:DUF4825 domain-containing protein n=1 Tax=Ornithinibacillus halotolerans TaxID=1274357 RepID=A0A916RVB2_9BACI|nr:hypothetical protein [Ornithinibacillus halotolerans]GGA71590.1 hypothetical protein GCM10008025_14380 [Ornithinibacillus halotolerans]
MKKLKRKSVATLLLFFALLVLTSCQPGVDNLIDGDVQVTDEMNEVISDYIVQKYSSSYAHTDKQFEVHKVYGTSEVDGVITVYIWSFFAGFNESTGMENQAAHSLPAVIQLSKQDNKYSVIDYTEPKDGSLYESSLKKMFPKKYVKLAQKDAGNIEDLQLEMDEKVKQWLEEIGSN